MKDTEGKRNYIFILLKPCDRMQMAARLICV